MTTELKQALEVIKKHCDTPKTKSYYEYMETATLKQRIQSIQGNLLHYVDSITIWYSYNQYIKKGETDLLNHPNYKKVELSKKQREDAIQSLNWLKGDIEACIAHLKE